MRTDKTKYIGRTMMIIGYFSLSVAYQRGSIALIWLHPTGQIPNQLHIDSDATKEDILR